MKIKEKTITQASTWLKLDIKTITLIICSLVVLTAFWIYSMWSFSSISYTISDQQQFKSDTYLGSPLLHLPLLEGSGTMVNGSGSIGNISATIDGSGASWKNTIKGDPNFPKSINGLIGYWKLDNSLLDSSGGNHNAIASGGINCNNNSGFLNYGCIFGSMGQFLDISVMDKFFNPRSGTISAWIYPKSNSNNSYVVQGVGSGSDRYYIQWSNGSIRMIMGTSTSSTVTVLEKTPLNQWYHVTMSWDNGKLYGYLNGKLIGSNSYASPYSTNTKFRIGNQPHETDNRSFPGTIDEVSFFNRKLTDVEISDIYDKTTQASQPISDEKKYLNFNNSSSQNYGRLRLNTTSEIQQLNLTNTFTIEAEIYLTNYPTDNSKPYTIYTDSIILGSGNALAVFPGGTLGIYANTGNTRYIFRADSKIPLNQWSRVLGSFNRQTGEMSLIVNGTEYGTNILGETPGITRSFANRPIIGMSGTWYNGFNGYIRNLKIWNKSFLNGQYSKDFIQKIKSGFDTDLAGKPNAKWLGSGTLDVIQIGTYPKNVEFEWNEGYLNVANKASFDQIKTAREAGPMGNTRTASWVAWVDDTNMINLIISTPIKTGEAIAIRALQNTPEWSGWDNRYDWNIDNTISVGPYFTGDTWIWKTSYPVAHISLGLNTSANDFVNKLETLKNLKIIDNIKTNN